MDLPDPEHAQEPIIIDGSNVARGWTFQTLLEMVDGLENHGWLCLVIVDASLRHKLSADEAQEMEHRIEEGWMQVPKGVDADTHILAEAQRLDAWVLSHDQFRDHGAPARRLDPALLLAPRA